MYSDPHGLLTWFGDAFSSQEIWQTGLRIEGTTPPTTGQLEDLDEAMAVLLATAAISFPSGRRYLGVKWAPQTTAGRYPDGEDAIEFLRPTPLNGAYPVGYPQIALVLSLRTSRSRGYASNGRMYIPSSLVIGTSSGTITEAAADAAAAAGSTFISAVKAAGPGIPAVMSAVGAGVTEQITGVRVGRVMDTQRRRRNALPELYSEPSEVPL